MSVRTVWQECRRAEIIEEIIAERARQDELFGPGNVLYTTENESTRLAVLSEEHGEVAKAILEGDEQGMRIELIQVAAVALAWLEVIG